jgi:hypothetical protein
VEGLLAAIALVLVAGVVVGNVFASRRRRRPAISIYRLLEDRLEDERGPG